MKRRLTLFTSIIVLCFCIINFIPVQAKNSVPRVSADSVVLMDGATGQILYGKNMNHAYPPASTTKTMTALLTLENCNLDDYVIVGKNPPKVDGSKIYLFEGEKIKVRELLYGLLLPSGNDCAEALAEHISGSIDNFAKLMNKRAKELGCTNTHFVNPSGLYDDKHRTCAKDLALIMKELVKHPEYIKIATTVSHKIPPTNKEHNARPLWNENKLIQQYSSCYYPGCLGGKTGYTIQSKHSYVAAATRNNRTLVVALVHDCEKTFFDDSRSLLNYGFKNYESVKLFSKGDKLGNYKLKNSSVIPLIASKDYYFTRKIGTTLKPKIEISIDKSKINNDFNKNDAVATASIIFKSGDPDKVKLYSGIDNVHSSAISLGDSKYSNIKKIINDDPKATALVTSLASVAIIAITSFIFMKFKKE